MIEIFQNESFLFLLLINIIAALGMNLVYSTGQLNLGQAAFMAVGAYTTAVTDKELHWPLAASLLASGVVAGLVALPVAVGANRVRGIYLIMGTLAAGEVVRVVIGNVGALGGLQGYSGIRPVSLEEVAAALLLVLIGTTLLMSSPLGLQMRSIFDDEEAAAAAGVATRRVKIVAVVLSAAVVGIAGGLTAKWLLFIAPRNFGVELSFRVALFTLIGGVHSLLGGVTGAFFVTYLLEALKRLGDVDFLPAWVQAAGNWRMVIYGALVVVIMVFRSEGLVNRPLALRLQRPWRRLRSHWPVDKRPLPKAPEATADGAAPAVALELSNVSHHFDGLQALAGMTLAVRQGEILGLIGANGAGKSTLTNVISGRHPLQTGSVRLFGQEVGQWRPERRARAGIARTFQSIHVFAHLTVAEHIRLGYLARNGRAGLLPAEILALIHLEEKLDALPGALSLAEQRRLEVGRALASAPLVMILDEPSAGLNASERAELAELIGCARASGVTVVLIEHNLDLVFGLADRVAAMDFGELLALDAPGEIMNSPRVQAAYLGTMEQ